MKTKIVFIIFVCIRCSLFGQLNNCLHTISGQVIDSSHTDPLETAEIEVVGQKNKHCITDKNGRFIITGLCSGPIELHISHRQCEHVHLFLQINKDTQFSVYLQHMEQEFEVAKVAGKTSHTEQSTLNARQLELRKGSSISVMMQDIGGISLLKTGSNVSKPVVNGLHSNRVIIVNNGIRQEGQNWGMEHAPEIDAFLASEIELLKGAEGLRYAADAIGGVVMIRPASIFKEKNGILSGEINFVGAANGRSGTISGFAGNKISDRLPLYWRVQGTLKQGGNIRAPGYYIANTGLKEQNYSLNLGYLHKRLKTEVFYSQFSTRIGIFSGSHIGNLDDLNKAINSDEPLIKSGFSYRINRPYQLVSHQLLKSGTEYEINGRNHIELIASYQKNHREEYDVLRSAGAYQGPSFDYYINTYMGDMAWVRSDFHSLNFKAGVTGMYQSNAYSGRFFIPGFYQKGLASYFTASKTFKNTRYEAGIRYDIKQLEAFLWRNSLLQPKILNFNSCTYILQAERRFQNNSRLILSHASAWRPPAPNELYSNGLHQGLASIEIGDSSLSPERSFNQSLNYIRQNKTYSIEAEVYYKYIQGFINLVPALPPQLTVRGAFPVFRYEQNNAEIYGLNMVLRRDFKNHFFIRGSSNILFGNNMSTGQALSQMPPLSGKAGIGYEDKNIFFNTFIQYTASQFRYIENSDYKAPPKGYYLIGLDASFRFTFRKQIVKLNFSISNLTNNKYREYLNRFRYFTDEQGFNLTARVILPLNLQLTTKKP